MEGFTRYEKARMIGARALQISMGAPFLVELDEKKLEDIGYNPVEIAKMEFDEGVIPLEVVRKQPEFVEDEGRHPMGERIEGISEELAADELQEEDEDADEVETTDESADELD